MLRSMTGFGAGATERVRVELRAVNHRFLQVKLRLPSHLSQLESDFEARVKEGLSRGVIQGTVAIEVPQNEGAVNVDATAAARLMAQLRVLRLELELDEEPTLAHVLSLPGVVRTESKSVDDDALVEEARRAFAEALDALVAMRAREGEALAADLTGNIDALEELVDAIRRRSPESVREHQAALEERVASLLGSEREIEEKDLAREIALLADKLDVAEETSRLGMHLEQLRELIAKGGAVGRKLDFLVQECLREVNTIGSKCNDAATAHAVVDAKTLVERLREQVQNVE
jgi:uncharacterized protein (TIGR00255 family)